MTEMNNKQKELAALIERIFEDEVVDESEREQLRQFWAQKGMTVPEVRGVVDAFVQKVWGEVIEDGVVTDDERVRLLRVVEGLKLPISILPDPLKKELDR
jgi:hypothetical protein